VSTSPTEPPDAAAIAAALQRRPLGGTGVSVTPVCIGGGPLGGMERLFGYATPAERGIKTALRTLEGPFNFLDTSNEYSGGESEKRIGEAIARAGGLPDGFVLQTKVDRDTTTGEYSGPRVRRSIEESLERLGLDRVPVLYLHDPEHISFEQGVAPGGPLEELVKIGEEGIAEHIGVAGGPVELLSRYLQTGAFQALITHNRWTLIDRSADELISKAVDLGVAVVNAAPYGSGILATGTSGRLDYAYRPADPRIVEQVRRMEELLAPAGVPLAAAALQFSTRDPRVASTIVGVSRPERIEQTAQLAAWPIPEELWPELESLAAPRETWQF
jgi:D-threo-aldose 1-dehydrogenase